MNIAIRTDASNRIGSGHVMRCLALADRLREESTRIAFICRDLSGNLSGFVESKGYIVHRFELTHHERNSPEQLDAKWPEDAEKTIDVLNNSGFRPNWLIIDHYALDKNWEASLRPYADRIMVIDDLANRPHDCDLLLDQNYYLDLDSRYEGLVPPRCTKLLGPRYALLRQEFMDAKKNLRERNGVIRRILVFFGSSDPTNETIKAIEGIRSLDLSDIEVDVVVGNLNLHKEEIRRACKSMQNTRFLCQVDNMAELMTRADLALGAGGSSTWERCLLGLPTITVVTADNQLQTTMALAASGAIWFLGISCNIGPKDYARHIQMIIMNPAQALKIGKNAMEIMASHSQENDARILKEIRSPYTDTASNAL